MRKVLSTILLLHFLFSVEAQPTQDLKLWYDKPAAKWTDALPIGNGRLGAMIFGGVEQDRIQFNEETLWTGEPREYNKKGAYKYLPKIRELLAAGKQKEAEDLAGKEFLGLKSNEGKKAGWVNEMRSLKGMKGNPSAKDYYDNEWKEMYVPSYEGWEAIGFEGLDGALWFRTSFDLGDDWVGKDLVLDLNRIRNQDFTYINGMLVGTMETDEPRKYVVPKELLVKGKNIIAIQVLNFFDKGGIGGYKDTTKQIGLSPKENPGTQFISLNKNWKYFIQDDDPPAVGQYQAAYQPFGDVWLNFKKQDKAWGYKRELDLSNAVSKTTYNLNGIEFTREYFASVPNQVLVIHLKANKPGSISFETVLNSPHKYSSVKKIDERTIAVSLKVRNGSRIRTTAATSTGMFRICGLYIPEQRSPGMPTAQ